MANGECALNGSDLQSFIEEAPVAAAMFDLAMRYIAVSQQWLKERGLDHSIIGRSAYDVFPDVDKIFRDMHRRALAGETIIREEDHFEISHGVVQWVRSEIRPWRDTEGKIGGVIVFAEDITSRKLHEQSLQRRENELRKQHSELEALYENAPIGLASFDVDLRYRRINRRLAAFGGRAVESHIGRTIQDIVPALAPMIEKAAIAVLAGETFVSGRELAGETPAHPGEVRYYKDHWYPVFDNQGKISGCGVVVDDVTDRKKAELRLKQVSERLEMAQSTANIGIWEWNHLTQETFVNEQWRSIFGITDEKALTFDDFALRLHPDDRENFLHAVRQAFSGDGVIESEGRIVRADDGATRWIASKGRIFFDADGAAVRSMGATWDITTFKEVQEALLQRAEDRYRRIVETAQEGIWLLDADARTSFVNPKMAELLGYTPGDMFRRPLMEFMDSEWQALAEETSILRSVRRIEARDFKFRRKDGSDLWTLLSSAPIFDGEAYQGALIMVMDFTERKHLEEEMRLLMEDLKQTDQRKDEFLATVGHELRTPLATIALAMDIIEGESEFKEKSRFMWVKMQRQVSHLSRMVEDILQVSRLNLGKIDVHRKPLRLDQLLSEVAYNFQSRFEESHIDLKLHQSDDQLTIHADELRLTQLFGNLLDNALKYTDKGGSVDLVMSRVAGDAVVTVRDNGVGIPRNQLLWIFELFNQMKHGPERDGSGIGVGLALSRRIVELHEGRIEARSEGVGKGSEFIVHLPLMSSAPAKGFD